MCSHYKRVSHLADSCTQPGGEIEGRSLEQAKSAQRAASQRSLRTGNSILSQGIPANVATIGTRVSYTPGSNNNDYRPCDSIAPHAGHRRAALCHDK